MIRLPQAFLVSLSLHVLMGSAILMFVAPNVVKHECAAEKRCHIVLSKVLPVFPAKGDTVKKQTITRTAVEPDIRHKRVEKPAHVKAAEQTPVVKSVEEAVSKPEPAQQPAVAAEVAQTAETVEMSVMPAAAPEPDATAQTDVQPEPAEAAPAPQTQTPSAERQTSEAYLNEHLAVIARLLRENLYYPKLARKRHIEGEVLASFMLLSDGTIREVSVKKHARYILDRAAVRTIESLSGLMPHPKTALTIEVPIRFVLN